MPLIIPVGFVQAAYELSLTGDPELMVTTMGHSAENVTGGDYGLMADHLMTSFGAHAMDTIHSAYTLVGVTLYVGQDGGPPAVYESTLAPVPGRAGGTVLPQNCAYLVRKRTSASGRRGRGRMYWPGVSQGGIGGNGTIDSTQLAGAQGAADDWLDDLMGAGPGLVAYPPVILHRSEGIGDEPPPTPVLTLQVDEVIATQRRRLRP